jgi:hypothetical protein
MDSDYLQFIRYKLQKRLKRLNTANYQSIHFVLVQTWGFLQGDDVIKGILDDLATRRPDAAATADRIHGGEDLVGSDEDDRDAMAYWVVRRCAESSDGHVEILVGRTFCQESQHDDCVEYFRNLFIEPLFDYLDEHIDDRRMILTLLKKYKHRCEWFRRQQLYEACKADTRQGEKALAYDLYEYLHDQGLQFHIEPGSASGRVDLVSAQSGRDRLVADTKIFNPGGGQNSSYLAKGFHQVYDYTRDYNEQFGYMVIFKTCEDDLSIQTQQQESTVPVVMHNHKAIFLLVIDIFPYDKSASQRGTLKTHEITQEDLIKAAVAIDIVKA